MGVLAGAKAGVGMRGMKKEGKFIHKQWPFTWSADHKVLSSRSSKALPNFQVLMGDHMRRAPAMRYTHLDPWRESLMTSPWPPHPA